MRGRHALKLFWDVDAAATLDEMRGDPDASGAARAARRSIMVLTYGGGPPVVDAYTRRSARRSACPSTTRSIPATHHPGRA